MVAGLAEEAKGRGKVFRRQPGLFGKPLGGEVIGVAVGRDLADLDPALFDAAFEIGVGEAERDAQLVRGGALGDAAVFMNRIEQAQGDLGLAVRGSLRVGAIAEIGRASCRERV